MELNNYFKTQFSNLEDAKKWYRKWKNEWKQEIPEHPEWSDKYNLTLRGMAGYISCFLTGDVYNSCYMSTKYGSEIYLDWETEDEL